jgi:hypothetical protein
VTKKTPKIDDLITTACKALQNNIDYLHGLSESKEKGRDIKDESMSISTNVQALLRIKNDMREDLERTKLQEFKDSELKEFILKSIPLLLQDLNDEELQAYHDAVDIELGKRKIMNIKEED